MESGSQYDVDNNIVYCDNFRDVTRAANFPASRRPPSAPTPSSPRTDASAYPDTAHPEHPKGISARAKTGFSTFALDESRRRTESASTEPGAVTEERRQSCRCTRSNQVAETKSQLALKKKKKKKGDFSHFFFQTVSHFLFRVYFAVFFCFFLRHSLTQHPHWPLCAWRLPALVTQQGVQMCLVG